MDSEKALKNKLDLVLDLYGNEFFNSIGNEYYYIKNKVEIDDSSEKIYVEVTTMDGNPDKINIDDLYYPNYENNIELLNCTLSDLLKLDL